MTFIASVVAKNGCAVIADSLVTTIGLNMSWRDFTRYVESKKGTDGSFNLDFKEVAGLFKSQPTHTKNYEEKLFKYGPYSIVTTAGSAAINGKKIEDLIDELIIQNNSDPEHENRDLETKVNAFCEFFSNKVAEHVNSSGSFSNGTSFIYTNYNRENHKTII